MIKFENDNKSLIMLKKKILLGMFILFTQLHATSNTTNNGFNSEMSHVVGEAVAGGAVTYIVDQYFPEYAEQRALLGFAIPSIVYAVIEGYHIAQDGNAKGQMLDIWSNTLGAAVGAALVDDFLLAPIIKTAPDGTQSVGVQVSHSF